MANLENETTTIDVRDMNELESLFEVVNNIVSKKYLSNLSKLEILPFENRGLKSRVFKVNKIIYDSQENNIQKLINTYASTVGFNTNIALIIDSDGLKTDLYLGVCGSEDSPTSALKSLYSNFVGNFPGSLGESKDIFLDNDELDVILNRAFQDNFVSSVSGVASLRNQETIDNTSVQTLDKLIETMQGKKYTTVIIGNYVNKELINDMRTEYELLYSKLKPFLNSILTFNESKTDGVSKTLTDSLSNSISKNKSASLSFGTSKSKSHTNGESSTRTNSIGLGLFSKMGLGVNTSRSVSKGVNWSDTSTNTTSDSQSTTSGTTDTESFTYSVSAGKSQNYSVGNSLQISYENKTIEQLLKIIDEQLTRIRENENYGFFAVAAYFSAFNPQISAMAASSYKSLICGNYTHVENIEINFWDSANHVELLNQYLKHLEHPEFKLVDGNVVSPATMVSGKELAIQMSMPKKSINGILVKEMVPFGCNIKEIQKDDTISIGNLYHMGKEVVFGDKKVPVLLNKNSLAMHTFISGSTGSGKSNTVFTMLEKLIDKSDTKFMVIEPVKGEYKNVFGNRHDVSVYGTNYKKTPLLRINPFSFPEDIHVLEHIDRLIEIFNVCWPMYAAMPAILKDAIEKSYIHAGWDLTLSETKYRDDNGNRLFPNFQDLLNNVSMVINESKYSTDSKGDYIGALCTRIKSLCTGIYSQIFTANEIDSVNLFDENVIVDLSRTGSIETKSLIMGILVIKLQEYRMANVRQSNRTLKHVTILEEAHNLLKRTSMNQSADSSNLIGKSVEMLANAIAEMRTYGEGFIIVDQSPELMDMSVIRNTNTKIIMRLPDYSDRKLVGKSASLNEKQIEEIARFKTGVAAVYQNDWEEPVLCSIEYKERESFEYHKVDSCDKNENVYDFINIVLQPIKKKIILNEIIIKKIKEKIYKLNVSSELKINLFDYLNSKSIEEVRFLRSKIIYGLFNSETALEISNSNRKNIDKWLNSMDKSLNPNIECYSKTEKEKIIALILNEKIKLDNDKISVDLFNSFMKKIKNTEERENVL